MNYLSTNTRLINKNTTRTSHSFTQKCLRQNLPHTINKTPVHILNKIKTHKYTKNSK